jgi:sigma-E factor negative regulatory protein RseA
MSTPEPSFDPQARRASLSALMDGDAAGCDDACRRWREDAGTRADWHAWHLIGDVMRSDEHRADAAHDARFLACVREQLAREPVVLAPMPTLAAVPPARRRSRMRWMAPTAVAAGFMAVAGVLVTTRAPAPDAAPSGGTVAAGNPAPAVVGVAAAPVPASAAEPALAADNLPMIRNPELDRYLAAHRQYANGGLQVAPGGAVRQAAVAGPGR